MTNFNWTDSRELKMKSEENFAKCLLGWKIVNYFFYDKNCQKLLKIIKIA